MEVLEGNELLEVVVIQEDNKIDAPSRDVTSLPQTQPLSTLKRPGPPNRGKRPPNKPLKENSDKICQHSMAIKEKETPPPAKEVPQINIKPVMMRPGGPLVLPSPLPRMHSAPLGDIEPTPVMKKTPTSSKNLPRIQKDTKTFRETSPKRQLLTKSRSESCIDKDVEESDIRIPNFNQEVNFRVIGTEFVNLQESDEHTAYIIQVDDGNERRLVSRRYAQFRTLYRDLPKAKTKKPTPPRKHYFRRYAGSVIQERIDSFNELCAYICTHKLYTSQIVLHFLDPNFSFPLDVYK